MGMEEIKDVKILCHIDAETLQQENAEFLAKYPTDDAQIDYYTDLAMKLFEEFEIDGDWDTVGTRKNIKTWFENKQKQMALLRQHPYWCEEAKAIIFKQKEKRKCDYDAASSEIQLMREFIHRHNNSLPAGDHILVALYKTFRYIHGEPHETETVTSRFIEVFEHYLGGTEPTKGIKRMISKGTKITRLVRKCCEEFVMSDGSIKNVTKLEDAHAPDDRTFDSFEKHYARFADCLSGLATEKMTIMSLNFLDFMTMSNGNSWSTCQFINSHGIFHGGDAGSSYHGQYKQGCLSYALDEPSFIFYTLPINFEGKDYYRCQKLTRMCCQQSDGVLVTGKCYPRNEDELIEKYRQTIQAIYSDINKIPNRWSFTGDTARIGAFVRTASGAAHYKDYMSSSQKPTISLCTKATFDIGSPMKIGHEAYCVFCGESLNGCSTNWLQCENHRRRMICKHCGKKIVGDVESHVIGDRLYCADCVFYCKVHERYELIETAHTTIVMSCGEVTVCNDGLERLAQCRDCGVYGFKSKMLRTDNGYSCKKHVRKYTQCELCGKYVPRKEIKTHNEHNYCDECIDVVSKFACRITKKDFYNVGDYVVMSNVDDIKKCYFKYNGNMLRYSNRIVRIVDAIKNYRSLDLNHYQVTGLNGDCDGEWVWDQGCIASAIVGINDNFIGKTLEEVRAILKGE